MSAAITLTELSEMSLSKLQGVGPKKLKGLEALGVESLLDLLTYYPRRYIDRTREAQIASSALGEDVLILGQVGSVSSRRTRNGKVMVVADIRDSTGTLRCTFFNQAWREQQLSRPSIGELAIFGKVEMFNGRRQMTNPVVDLVGTRTGRIVSVYPLSEKSGLSTWEIGEWVAQILRRCAERSIADPVPQAVIESHQLVSRQAAFDGIHAPESMAHMLTSRNRLVFDELLRLQLSLVQRQRDLERNSIGIVQQVGNSCGVAPGLVDSFLQELPYELTSAQQRAIAEIDSDLARPIPMLDYCKAMWAQVRPL